eukprot:762473-Hanusia_phi.AAC.1
MASSACRVTCFRCRGSDTKMFIRSFPLKPNSQCRANTRSGQPMEFICSRSSDGLSKERLRIQKSRGLSTTSCPCARPEQ